MSRKKQDQSGLDNKERNFFSIFTEDEELLNNAAKNDQLKGAKSIFLRRLQYSKFEGFSSESFKEKKIELMSNIDREMWFKMQIIKWIFSEATEEQEHQLSYCWLSLLIKDQIYINTKLEEENGVANYITKKNFFAIFIEDIDQLSLAIQNDDLWDKILRQNKYNDLTNPHNPQQILRIKKMLIRDQLNKDQEFKKNLINWISPKATKEQQERLLNYSIEFLVQNKLYINSNELSNFIKRANFFAIFIKDIKQLSLAIQNDDLWGKVNTILNQEEHKDLLHDPNRADASRMRRELIKKLNNDRNLKGELMKLILPSIAWEDNGTLYKMFITSLKEHTLQFLIDNQEEINIGIKKVDDDFNNHILRVGMYSKALEKIAMGTYSKYQDNILQKLKNIDNEIDCLNEMRLSFKGKDWQVLEYIIDSKDKEKFKQAIKEFRAIKENHTNLQLVQEILFQVKKYKAKELGLNIDEEFRSIKDTEIFKELFIKEFDIYRAEKKGVNPARKAILKAVNEEVFLNKANKELKKIKAVKLLTRYFKDEDKGVVTQAIQSLLDKDKTLSVTNLLNEIKNLEATAKVINNHINNFLAINQLLEAILGVEKVAGLTEEEYKLCFEGLKSAFGDKNLDELDELNLIYSITDESKSILDYSRISIDFDKAFELLKSQEKGLSKIKLSENQEERSTTLWDEVNNAKDNLNNYKNFLRVFLRDNNSIFDAAMDIEMQKEMMDILLHDTGKKAVQSKEVIPKYQDFCPNNDQFNQFFIPTDKNRASFEDIPKKSKESLITDVNKNRKLKQHFIRYMFPEQTAKYGFEFMTKEDKANLKILSNYKLKFLVDKQGQIKDQLNSPDANLTSVLKNIAHNIDNSSTKNVNLSCERLNPDELHKGQQTN